MAAIYTIERIENGVEVRLALNHEVRCRVWMINDIVGEMLRQLTTDKEAGLRASMGREYDLVLSRLIALLRAVMDGKPGGTVEAPDEYARVLPFLN
jgi:hypothetical protein